MIRLSIVTALCLSTQLAAAEVNKPAGKQEYAAGKQLYASGDYLGAAKRFEAAFGHDPDPAYIFNVGQAYRRRAEQKNGNVEADCYRSKQAYQTFLELVPEPPNRKEVDTYIKEMEGCAGTYKPEPVVKPVDKPIDKPIDPPPIEKPIEHPPGEGRDVKQWIGIGMGGAGLVVVGVASYFLLQARAKAQEFDDGVKANLPIEQLQLIEEDGKSYDRKGIPTMIVGGSLVIGGAVLYLLGRRSTTEHKVTVAPSREGAMVFGTFRF